MSARAAVPFILASPEDILALRRQAHSFFLPAIGSIDVTLPNLSATERAHWQRRLTFLVHVCGCQAGALAALAVVVLSIVNSRVALAGPAAMLTTAGAVLLAAMVAKGLAILLARIALYRRLNKLLRRTCAGAMRTEN